MYSTGGGWIPMYSTGGGWIPMYSTGGGWIPMYSTGGGCIVMVTPADASGLHENSKAAAATPVAKCADILDLLFSPRPTSDI